MIREFRRLLRRISCRFVFLFAAALSVCGITGCNSKNVKTPYSEAVKSDFQPGNGEITIMHVDAGKKEFQAFISEAEEKLQMKINVVECPINADSRHAKISMLLSSGDTSIDIISVNDEMISEFKYAGYLEPLEGDVMNEETASCFPQEYLRQMVMVGDSVYSVPYSMDILAMWVNEAYLKEAGLSDVSTKKKFMQFLTHDWGDGRFAYGGAWEKTYVYNEIGEFISLFGGDYYDWNNEQTRAAVVFLKDCAERGYTSSEQLLDQYEQTNQKFINGKYGLIITYSGTMNTFAEAGVYGSDQIHLTPLPDMGADRTTYIATWQYVLNKASGNKEAAKRFLEYAAGREGSIRYSKAMNRMPAREDIKQEELVEVTGYKDMKMYLETTRLKARPLPEDSIGYISSMGTLFQKYVTGELDLDEYCRRMQQLVDKNLLKQSSSRTPQEKDKTAGTVSEN